MALNEYVCSPPLMVRLACPDAEGFPVAQADGKAMTPSSADSNAVERNPRRKNDRPIDFLKGKVVIFFVFIFLLKLDC